MATVSKNDKIKEQNLAYHEQAAESYDATMDKDPGNQLIRQRVKEKLCHLLRSGLVLDFGGGTGLDLEWLTANNYSVIFCEPSPGMRGQAIHYNNTRLNSDRITFLEGESTDFRKWAEALPFTGKVDAILSNFGPLNYIPDIRLVFENLARDMNLRKRMKWHRRNAIRSLLLGVPFVMYIPDAAHLQTVIVHTVKEIKQASARWFTFGESEPLDGLGFVLIHLIRNGR
jgi:SAM-dependent methyltransferase